MTQFITVVVQDLPRTAIRTVTERGLSAYELAVRQGYVGDVDAWLASLVAGGSGDHGSLTGLADDDHTQYHNDARGDIRYAPLAHSHGDLYYTETEVDTLLTGKAAASHSHTTVVEASATQILALDDAGKLFVNAGATDHTITIPPNADVAFPIGTEFGAVCESTGNIIFAQGSGVTITSISSNKQVKASGGGAYLVKTGTDTWALMGDLEA